MRELLRDLGRASTYRDFFDGIREGLKDPWVWGWTVGGIAAGLWTFLVLTEIWPIL